MLLYKNTCMVFGSCVKADKWYDANHPVLSASPKHAQSTPGKAQELGALLEALSKGWPI